MKKLKKTIDAFLKELSQKTGARIISADIPDEPQPVSNRRFDTLVHEMVVTIVEPLEERTSDGN